MRPAKRRISGTEIPASAGVQARRDHDPLWCPRLDLLERDRVVALHQHVGTELARYWTRL